MASGKKNYFRHSFYARNDDFIEGLIERFGLSGYFYWFALVELCAEQAAEEMPEWCKFHASRLYRELRCNSRRLQPVLDYMATSRRLVYNHTGNIYQIRILNLPKYMGKYQSKNSPKPPNKRKENKRKDIYRSTGPSKAPSPAAGQEARKPDAKQSGGKKSGGGLQAEVTEVIFHLNAGAGKSFKPEAAGNAKFITARLREGYKPADLKHVIDLKVKQWRDDPKMAKYLRPATLFNSEKFDAYLNELHEIDPEQKLANFFAEAINRGGDDDGGAPED